MKKHNAIRWALERHWHALHPNVQRRFARAPGHTEPIVYLGLMDEVRCSRAGWLFAQLTRVIGNPLSPHTGRRVPMTVVLTTRDGQPGVFWHRTYFFRDRRPFAVTSVKKNDAKGRMTECVGGGFGMFLDVCAENGDLVFRSTRYFMRVFGCTVALPHWLGPGTTEVIHSDLGHGSFRFTIRMCHRWLGETFFQTGVFNDPH